MQSGAGSGQSTLERIEHLFEELIRWAADYWAPLLGGLVGLLVLGGVAAGVYEWSRTQRAQAFAELAAVERDLAAALPSDETGLGTSEPANPELALKARETALARFEALSVDHRGSLVGDAASLRAAEMEIDLGRLADAEERLVALTGSASDPEMRATSLWLLGFVLEELDRPLEAAEAYLRAGAEKAYAGRAGAFWQAGLTFERIGELERAVAAYDAVLSVSSEFAERQGVESRLGPLRARLAQAEPAAAAASPTDAAEEGEPAGAEDTTRADAVE